MTKTTTLVLMTCLALAGASNVSAQVQPAFGTQRFVSVNVGAQPARTNLNTGATFPIHDETGSFSARHGVKNGPFVEASAGVNVWRQLSVGVGYSAFSSNSNASVTATIPDPLFYDHPGTSTQVALLARRERGVHLMVGWLMPVTDKIDVTLSVGPSFILVRQQIVSSVTVPVGTQTFSTNVSAETGTVKGVNVGFDGTYMFSPTFGAGLLIRYAGGTVDLPSVEGVKAGGFQAGIGARLRF
jgi:hypothetical protein